MGIADEAGRRFEEVLQREIQAEKESAEIFMLLICDADERRQLDAEFAQIGMINPVSYTPVWYLEYIYEQDVKPYE